MIIGNIAQKDAITRQENAMPKKIFFFIFFAVLISFTIHIIIPSVESNILSENDNSQKNDSIISRDYSSDTYRTADGKFKKIIYPTIRNMPDKNGNFRPYIEVTNFTITDNNMTLEWNGKKVTFEFYDVKNNKKEKFKDKDLIKKQELEFKNDKKTNKGNYYFTHNFTKDKSKQPDKFGYDIITENVDCSVKGNSLICDEQKIDFSQAIQEQNLTVSLNPNYIEISGADLSFIDPSILYNFNSTYQNVNMWAYDWNTASNVCTTDQTPPSQGSEPSQSPCTRRDITTNANLDSSDNGRYSTTVSTTEDGMQFFKSQISGINISDITLLNWSWEGNSDGVTQANTYLWNSSSLSYIVGPTATSLADVVLSISTSDFNVINSTNFTHFVVVVENGDGASFSTDFVSLSITYDDLVVNTPTSNQEILNTLSTTLNTSQAGYNNTIWYTWTNGLKNYTLCTSDNECQAEITFPRQGYYNLTVYGNKSDGTIKQVDVTNLFVGNQSSINVSEDLDYYYNELYDEVGGLFKFNISQYYNQNKIFKSSLLGLYIYSAISSPNGNMIYWNIPNQTWTDSDSVSNIKNIVNTRKNQTSNTFTSSTASTWTSLIVTNSTINDFFYNNFTSLCVEYASGLVTNSSIDSLNWAGTGTITLGITYLDTQDRYLFNSSESIGNFPYLNISYYTPNTAPSLTLTLANYTNYTSTGIVNLTFNISDDNDYVKNISLYLNGSFHSVLSNQIINVSINNTFNFTLSGLGGGNRTWKIEVFDSDGNTTNSTQYMFHINTKPQIATIKLNLTNATDIEDILCNITGLFDFDNESLAVTYEWYNNSIAKGINVSFLGEGNTTTGDTWYCSAFPNDNIENGTLITSSSVSINTGFVSPLIANTNSTTNTTNIISNATYPTNNNSWINLSVLVTDPNTEAWTAYFCSSELHTISGCTDTTYCRSDFNSTSKTLSCNISANLPLSSYSYYVFVVDNSSLFSSTTEGSFHINHPPTIPTLIQPLTNISINYTWINFSSTDSDLDILNYTIYNNSKQLYSGEGGYNFTNLDDGIYYLKSYSMDTHGYSVYSNSSTYNFTVDATPPNITNIGVSSTSVYTTDSVTFSVDVTDAFSSIPTSSCKFELFKTDLTPDTWNITSNSKTGNNLSKSQAVLAYGTGTLEFRKIYCSDSLNNMVSNASVNINITISTASSGTTTGGGGATTEAECVTTQDCITKYNSSNYYCYLSTCTISLQSLASLSKTCNYDGYCDFNAGESYFNCPCDVQIGCGVEVEKSGDCPPSSVDSFKGLIKSKIFITLLILASVSALLLFYYAYDGNRKLIKFRDNLGGR